MKQNDISNSFLKAGDIKNREKEIISDVSNNLGFKADSIISESRWWNSGRVGAFHVMGTYQGMKAVLKVQGVKPETSEIDMIYHFKKASQNYGIRPPEILSFSRWQDDKAYEAIIMEDLKPEQRLFTKKTNQQAVGIFFQVYDEYRKMLSNNTPWLESPDGNCRDRIIATFDIWRQIAVKIHPKHPLFTDSDDELIKRALEVLVKGYESVDLTFQHGHLSTHDIYKVGDKYVLLSNLYWSFRPPYYDLVFGWHWHRIETDAQDIIWWEEEMCRRVKEESLYNLARLERLTAGLNLDILHLPMPMQKVKINIYRNEINQLIKVMS